MGELRDALIASLGDERMVAIVALRCGDPDDPEATGTLLTRVADTYGLTRERIRQIEVKAMRLLAHPQRRDLLCSLPRDRGIRVCFRRRYPPVCPDEQEATDGEDHSSYP